MKPRFAIQKAVSSALTLILAVAGSLVATESAQATPLTIVKSMGYRAVWAPGSNFTLETSSEFLTLSSYWVADIDSSMWGQVISGSAVVSGDSLEESMNVGFYPSSQDALDEVNRLGQTADIFPAPQEPVLIPTGTLAIRIFASSSLGIEGFQTTVPVGTYSTHPAAFAGTTEIDLTALEGRAYVSGFPGEYTTPPGTTFVQNSYEAGMCLNMDAIDSSTRFQTELHTIHDGGSNQIDDFDFSITEVDFTNGTPMLLNSADSFDSGQLAVWEAANTPLSVYVFFTDIVGVAPSDQHDMDVSIVDQNGVSLLGDCRPAAPAGTGTLSFSNEELSFAPGSAVGQDSYWGVNLYQASDNSLVSTTLGYGRVSTVIPGPIIGRQRVAFPAGESFYTRLFVREIFRGIESPRMLESELSASRSSNFRIPGSSALEPIINSKSMGYATPWTPGQNYTTFTEAGEVTFASTWVITNVEEFEGQPYSLGSLSSPSSDVYDYAVVDYFSSAQDAIADTDSFLRSVPQAGSVSDAVIAEGTVAMRVTYITSISNGEREGAAIALAGTYSSMPWFKIDGTSVTMELVGPSSGFILVESSAGVQGAESAITTPANADVLARSFEVLGCFDMSRVTEQTQYFAELSVNGVSVDSNEVDFEAFATSTVEEVQFPPNYSSDSFDSGPLATWLADGLGISIIANALIDGGARSTQYDAALTVVDQDGQSLLGDCRPTATNGSGTLSLVNQVLIFTPDATVSALDKWGVELFKASDDSLVSIASAGHDGTPELTGNFEAGESYYAKVFVRERILSGTVPVRSVASPTRSASFTFEGVSVASTSDSQDSSTTQSTSLWIKQITTSILDLRGALDLNGGSISLGNGDYSGLKTVTIGGNPVTFKLDGTGSVTISVPGGTPGTTADMLVSFAGGTVIIQDGIKYLKRTEVSKVPERSISVKAGAKRFSATAIDAIRQAAFANVKNTDVSCIGYAAANTSAAKAAAKVTAAKVCSIAISANPDLRLAPVSVLVNKARSVSESVGIKVYRATY